MPRGCADPAYPIATTQCRKSGGLSKSRSEARHPEVCQWESQSVTSQSSKTGQRYIHHRQVDSNILFFVRGWARSGTRTVPYMFLGFVDYVSHERERPTAFVWRLCPMPADFVRETKVAAG